MPVAVAEDALENEPSKDAIEQSGRNQKKAVYRARDGRDDRNQPVVQVKLMRVQWDYDGPHTALYALLCSSTGLAYDESSSTAEIEQVAQGQPCGQEADKDESLSLTSPCRRA